MKTALITRKILRFLISPSYKLAVANVMPSGRLLKSSRPSHIASICRRSSFSVVLFHRVTVASFLDFVAFSVIDSINAKRKSGGSLRRCLSRSIYTVN
jgi:hypothetical protein